MVGIEDEESKELDGATLDPDSINNLFENILITLSQLSTESAPQRDHSEEAREQVRRNRPIPNAAFPLDSFGTDDSRPSSFSSSGQALPANSMTILPKKKAHKERNEQREHRHHSHGAASSQASGYSEYSHPHPEFGQEQVRLPHSDLDHRPGNLADLIHGHGHLHSSSYQPQPHSFPEMPNAEAYRQPSGDRSVASSSSLSVRHERNLPMGSRKERPTAQFDLESSCHAKKRCLSPGFAEKNFPAAKQGANCGLTAHQGLYASSHPQALLPGSSAQEELSNSDDNNSEDEYYGNITRKTIEDEEKFAQLMEKKGWCIKQMASDGACLFRAVADQIYGDQDMHDEVRTNCLNYMSKNEEHFSQYVTEEFSKYIARKRNVHCHGNHLEIQALAEVYNRPIEIYYYDIEPRNVFHGEYKTDYPPIRLSYHGSVHYNSIREPYSATVGIGLGLPEFQPGLADKQLLSEAIKRSEENQIEEAMLKDKLRDSDWDLMQSQIENQIAQESYRDYVNSRFGASNASSAATAGPATGGKRSPRSKQQQHQHNLLPLSPRSSPPITAAAVVPASPSPRTVSPTSSATSAVAAAAAAAAATGVASDYDPGLAGTSSATAAASAGAAYQHPPNPLDYLPAEMSNWDENAILARALAESTLHYYEAMRRTGDQFGSDGGSSNQPGCSKHS